MCSAVDALALDEWWVMDVGLRLGEDGIADDVFRAHRKNYLAQLPARLTHRPPGTAET